MYEFIRRLFQEVVFIRSRVLAIWHPRQYKQRPGITSVNLISMKRTDPAQKSRRRGSIPEDVDSRSVMMMEFDGVEPSERDLQGQIEVDIMNP